MNGGEAGVPGGSSSSSTGQKRVRADDHYGGVAAAVNGDEDAATTPRKKLKAEQQDDDSLAEARNGSSSAAAALNGEVTSSVKKEEEPDLGYDYEAYQREVQAEASAAPSGDLYLDTINRSVLDFDFERLCSVSLSNINVYACLVCGRYYQGRGKSSPAYAHSIHDDHHVFLNLQTLKCYILPDSYEVNDPSLDDVRYLLSPTFTPKLLRTLDTGSQPCYTLSKQVYKPGFIGLNNIKQNSYMNVVIQALLHVTPLRDYFIFHSQPSPKSPASTTTGAFDADSRSELVKRFGLLARRLWNPKNFKSQVSPHEFLQEVSAASNKKFKITEQGDPLEFLSWLLNALHRDLGGTRKANSSIVYSAFQGELRIEDQAILVKSTEEDNERPKFDLGREIKETRSPFLFLAIDLPPIPVFQDSTERNNIIPQVPLSQVLAKYNGITTQETAGRLRRYKLTRLPPFLILSVKRFTSNNFVEEKNPTIINFPLKGIDMQDFVDRKIEGVDANRADGEDPSFTTMYDLVANITHESTAGTAHDDTKWRVQVHTKAGFNGNQEEEEWYQIQDLIVEEINRQMIFLGESYIQIWERRLPPGQAVHKLHIDSSSANLKQKTTKSLSAAANIRNAVAEGAVITQQMPLKAGTYAKSSFKVKRDRPDSGMDI